MQGVQHHLNTAGLLRGLPQECCPTSAGRVLPRSRSREVHHLPSTSRARQIAMHLPLGVRSQIRRYEPCQEGDGPRMNTCRHPGCSERTTKTGCPQHLAQTQQSLRWKYAMRRAAKICPHCSRPALPSKSCCQQHADMQKKSSRKMCARRRAVGLCYHCEQPALPNRTRCASHQDKARIAAKRAREAYLPAGRCTRCSHPAIPSRSQCQRHLAEGSQPPNREWRGTRSKRRYELAVSLGLCPLCLIRLASGQLCVDCQSKSKVRIKKKYHRSRASSKCVRCIEPAEIGKSRCSYHLDYARKDVNARNARKRVTA